MDLPAIYRIHVVGEVDPCSLGIIGGMQVTRSAVPSASPETDLIGSVPDQAALAGILNTLYEMHLPVVSVECLRAAPPRRDEDADETESTIR